MKAWAAGICALAIAAAMLRLLAPEGSLVKMLRLVIGALTLCVVIGPLLQLAPDLAGAVEQAPGTDVSSDFSSAVQQQTLAAMQQAVERTAGERLQAAGISYQKIEAQMDTSSGSDIHIKQVVVTLPPGGPTMETKILLERDLGVAVEVEHNGG